MTSIIRSVLITGASGGVGGALVDHFADAGWRVFAGVRTLPAATARRKPAVVPLRLDVLDPASLADAQQAVADQLRQDGLAGLTGLVNNAGKSIDGPLEITPVEELADSFAVNVIGAVAAAQAFLPLLRPARGRIVNIGSVGGMISLPFGASLTASKHAIEALTDSLRMELWEAGIHVTLLQPASIDSGSAEKLAAALEGVISELPEEGKRRYAAKLRGFMKVTMEKETTGSPPEVVGRAVLEALRADRPPIRRVVGKDGGMIKLLARHVPDALRDKLLRKVLLGAPEFGAGD